MKTLAIEKRIVKGIFLSALVLLFFAEFGIAQPVFEDIAPDIQLIKPLQRTLPNGMEALVVWPSPKYIDEHYAIDDISNQLTPIYPAGAMEDAKPIRPGGMPPEVAVEEAELWFKEILKAKWIPPNLSERLIPLRNESQPQWSTVIARYQTQGHKIQITQTRWGVCVVIHPRFDDEVIYAEQIAKSVFAQFFTMGEEMSSQKGRQVSADTPGLTLYEPAQEKASEIRVRKNWWNWLAWYTDGNAVAVFLHKRFAGEVRTPSSEDPWF